MLNIAKRMYKEKSLLVMGRGLNFATCLEGALKIKVIFRNNQRERVILVSGSKL